MAVFDIEYSSTVLGQYRQACVLYPDRDQLDPEESDKDIPVLYLLHGMGGNHRSWLGRTHLERLVRKTNLIVIMPNTENGWYTDTTYGVDYYKAIAEELPQIMRRFFPNMTKKRSKTFIAGLSMGGYGAFKLAFRTNQFAYAGSFSGALGFDQSLKGESSREQAYWQGVLGDDASFEASDNNLLVAAQAFDKKTKLYAWCGKEDFLYEVNQQAIENFRSLGLEVDYRTDHGTHDWYYWEKQIEVFLDLLPISYVKEERLS